MYLFVYSIHICCTLTHTKEGVADRFLNDVKQSMEEIMANPDSEIGGMVSNHIEALYTP